MGVPKFYRWLSERYPLINQLISNTTMLPEIDNFYLDMNGIIHACTHPNDSDTSIKLSLRDMILAIFRYIDRCVSGIVKPKKLLYLAIDGVAPRAKLNQQRSRRFRAGQERIENLMKAKQKGEIIDESTMFDSNCITPGTEFMSIIDKHLRYFIRKKIKEDPLWKNLEVVYSGHDVPGEGEHKIMQYIREARSKPNYQPNQRHCLYGQDADLIMLGLATHEPHFTLLREVVDFSNGRGQGGGKRDTIMKQTKESRFQLLHLSVLREYIEVDFANNHQGEPIDRERLIDDFIFLTFLVGNDFLPHLPTLDISEHAFDFLFDIYRTLIQEKVGYIVGNGEIVDYERLGKLFSMIGVREEEILRTREIEQKEFNAKKRKNRRGYQVEEILSLEEEEQEEIDLQIALDQAIAESFEESKLANQLQNNLDLTKSNSKIIETNNNNNNNNNNNSNNNTELIKSDKNYRARYYFEKFRIVPDNYSGVFNQFINDITTEYLKGIIWCLAYYMKGCISWTWYFPYHYGPMLGDMTNIVEKSTQIIFELGQPFLPFQQLLGCLPPSSMNLLPLSYQWLMNSSLSPIIEYYPLHFEIDMNGKRNPWEAVVLLPFIDSKRLLEAEKLYCPDSSITLHERQRNSFGKIIHIIFDPINMETIPSCNPTIGLLDITKCQSKLIEKDFNLSPELAFASKLIPGTVRTCAGFPSLGVIPIASASLDSVKLNVFGSESRYKSVILTVFQRTFTPENFQFELLLGRSVFVNYPLIHEAKVVGVTCATKSCKLKTRRVGKQDIQEIEQTIYSDSEKIQWLKEAGNEENKYLKGRGEPGTGGIVVGDILIRLLVVPLQGMKTDRLTGIRKKVFGETIADIPIQMALWTSPVADARFEERDEIMSVDSMFPYGSIVVATEGPLKGMTGKIIGPHGPITNSSDSRTRLSNLKNNNSNNTSSPRVVDVEFTIYPPEPPFGYALNVSVKDEYYSSREICRQLGITPSVLGLICGSLFVDPIRMDIGLNLKKNGEYQLLEYARGIIVSNNNSSNNSLPEPGIPGKEIKTCWNSGDTIRIIGSLTPSSQENDNNNNNNDDNNNKISTSGQTIWEYSEKAVDLIRDYMETFPNLFSRLQSLSNQRKYTINDLFGLSGAEAEKELDRLQTWMKSQPFYLLPRSPLTTSSMSKDAIHAVERAVDVRVSRFTSDEGQQEIKRVVKQNVPVEVLFRDELYGPFDTPLTSINPNPPELGDRVINLVATGVPFGLKGTVITIHSGSGYVEVLFDEEFAAGKSLQGNCSPFRGALVSWSSVLCVSTNPFSSSTTNNNNNNNNQSSRNKLSNGSSNKNTTPSSKTPKNEKNSVVNTPTQLKYEENNISSSTISTISTTAPLSPFVPSDNLNLSSESNTSTTSSSSSSSTTSTTVTSTPPQMKKVTSILRREMLSRQNNSPSTPTSTSIQTTPSQSPSLPNPPANIVITPVASIPLPSSDSTPIAVSSSPSIQSTENNSSSSSVAEKLLKARAAMKEKLLQSQNNSTPPASNIVPASSTITTIPTTIPITPSKDLKIQQNENTSEKVGNSSFQSNSIRLKISGADLFPTVQQQQEQKEEQKQQTEQKEEQKQQVQLQEQEQEQEENQEQKEEKEELKSDSIKSSQPMVKQLVPSRVARKIVIKDQKK